MKHRNTSTAIMMGLALSLLFTSSLPSMVPANSASNLAYADISSNDSGIYDVTVKIIKIKEKKSPDEIPNIERHLQLGKNNYKIYENDGPGDYYSKVKIDNTWHKMNKKDNISGNNIKPNWEFTGTYHEKDNSLVPITIGLWDYDSDSADEKIDISPKGDKVDLLFDLSNQETWFGDVSYPQNWSEGSGHNSARVYFEITAKEIPDSDGDGIEDRRDKCIDKPETYNNYRDGDGCPDRVPEKKKKPVDSDKDGIPDKEDKCPKTYGTQSNGCPIPITTISAEDIKNHLSKIAKHLRISFLGVDNSDIKQYKNGDISLSGAGNSSSEAFLFVEIPWKYGKDDLTIHVTYEVICADNRLKLDPKSVRYSIGTVGSPSVNIFDTTLSKGKCVYFEMEDDGEIKVTGSTTSDTVFMPQSTSFDSNQSGKLDDDEDIKDGGRDPIVFGKWSYIEPGNGYKCSNSPNPFDFDNDGFKEHMCYWYGPETNILFVDFNDNKQLDNGYELLNAEGYTNAIEIIRSYPNLCVNTHCYMWQDINSNILVDDGELRKHDKVFDLLEYQEYPYGYKLKENGRFVYAKAHDQNLDETLYATHPTYWMKGN